MICVIRKARNKPRVELSFSQLLEHQRFRSVKKNQSEKRRAITLIGFSDLTAVRKGEIILL
jgi:hypothetical protein